MNGCPKHQAGGTRTTATAECICEPVNEKDANACDCGHAVWWHNDTRGCGYKGFDPRHKCPCSLLAHEAVDAVVTREKAQAWDEGYDEGLDFETHRARDREWPARTPNPYRAILPVAHPEDEAVEEAIDALISRVQAEVQEVLDNDYLMRQEERVAHVIATRLFNRGLLIPPALSSTEEANRG